MTPLLLSLALAVAAPAPKKADEPAPTKPEGEWVVDSLEGPKTDAPGPGAITFRFTGDKVFVKEPKRDKEEVAGFTVDLTKKPAAIDIRPDQGPKDQTILGIFEVKGDTMKLCFAHGGMGDRPTEFKGDPEKGIMFITLKRAKADK
jgi:uncharacterized protein (TIGR03067 family)